MYIWKTLIFIIYLFILIYINVVCIIAEARTFLKGTSKKVLIKRVILLGLDL